MMVIAVLLTETCSSRSSVQVFCTAMLRPFPFTQCPEGIFFVTTGRNSDMGWIAEYGSPIGYYAKLMEAGLRIFHSDQF